MASAHAPQSHTRFRLPVQTVVQQRLYSEARAVMGWLAMELGCVTLTQLGRRFNRDVGTMSRGVRRIAD
jgi:chromosomal replication initiation ATPase DnaA